MFLKRVVLNGFKSFASRTEFDFAPGITAVVGPNGCGKSNLLDAVRWVLGEQSARTLRASAMQDVIFSGSRTRKPAACAEVQLTFENPAGVLATDESEVTVGRVLYRSGESEYLRNGQVCRLKDVRDLFLDTGVGVDAYSVIEQGRVDLMLQANPIERREIFEEAAGISRYRLRRTETQRKLERAQQNLLRLGDVLDELEKRLRSVKLAAGKARNYQEYDARLRELRSLFSLAEFHQLRQTQADLQSRSQGLADVLGARRSELAAQDAQAAELANELQALDERIRALETELSAAQTSASALAERQTRLEQRSSELALEQQQAQAALEQEAQRVAALATRAEHEQAEAEKLAAAETEHQERVADLQALEEQARKRSAAARASLDSEKAQAFAAARRSSLLASEQTALQAQAQRDAARLQTLQQRQDENSAQQAALAERESALAGSLLEMQAQRGQLQDAHAAVLSRIQGFQAQSDEIAAQLSQARDTRTALRSRLETLEDLERRQEGLGGGTRWLLGWRDQPSADGSVLGLVADLLKIDDPRVGCLQVVLDRFEDQVVVADTYAFLAELGRRADAPDAVAVIGMDRLADLSLTENYAEAPGFVARAVDWVQCDPRHARLAQALLGRVFVVDVLERGLALAAQAPEGYWFVSLKGECVASGGALSTGSPRQRDGLISRKAEIRRVHKELDDAELALQHCARQAQALEEQLSDERLQQEALREQSAVLDRRRVEAQADKGRFNDLRQRLESDFSSLRGEVASAERSAKECGEQLARILEQKQVADAAEAQLALRIAELDEQLKQLDGLAAVASADLVAAQVERGRAVERRAARDSSAAELRRQHAEAVEQEDRAQSEAESLAGRGVQVRAELDETGIERNRLAGLIDQHQTQVLLLRQERQTLRAGIESSSSAARELQRNIEQVDDALRVVEVDLREAQVRQETLAARVAEELSLDLAALHAGYQHAEQDWESVRAEIEELRTRIARLGNVNLDSLTELQELTPRYENLVAQRTDLTGSIARLEALIAELDHESRIRFVATFDQIRANFQELFRKLFGGGKADVVLENPDDPLGCGIEIIARPPGKEPQSISLLSGGEKTMAAVALLFAVFRSRPSPFAILDEVDAALDESNVGRFGAILHDFLDQTQFIVITHSKRTMQSADMLYGITTEEPGVSKRVGVRVDECMDAPAVA